MPLTLTEGVNIKKTRMRLLNKGRKAKNKRLRSGLELGPIKSPQTSADGSAGERLGLGSWMGGRGNNTPPGVGGGSHTGVRGSAPRGPERPGKIFWAFFKAFPDHF